MADEVKVPDAPEAADAPKLIDNPRTAIEDALIAESETFQGTPEVKEEVKPETPELSEVERVKQSVQKRINQVVAQKKSAEDQLAEAQAEIARLKAAPIQVADKKDDSPPTIEQVEAYILKMAEEGNKKEEIAATRYLIRMEKDSAIKEVEDRQIKMKQEGEARFHRENQALLDLAKDYIVYDDKGQVDMKSDLTLANQKGKLFESAMALYNDPELNRLYYNDPDRAAGLRRAVQDANKELHAQGLIKTPKVTGLETRRDTRQLADPDAVEAEDTPTPSSNDLSDAEKVREEIKQRNKMRYRKVS